METASVTGRVTRSQTLAAFNNESDHSSKKGDDYETSATKSRKENVLIDITNDSPIAGLAMGTPTSSIMKKRRSRVMRTPGSGETLLRDQVKSLLQKVEEEAEVGKEGRPILSLKTIVISSPIGLLAPTPANTPLLGDNGGNDLTSAVPSPVLEHFVSQVEENHWRIESEKSMIMRSLLHDFYEKSEVSSDSSRVSSVLAHNGASDDDASSVWSILANASEGEEEVVEEEEMENWDDDYYDEADEEEDLMVKFEGKHTRFVYNSDGEIVEEEEVDIDSSSVH